MAVPWLRLIDGVLGATDLVRSLKGRATEPDERLAATGRVESHLTGVVMSALKEVFDRDSERLELERQRAEDDRRRAERALRLELLRQAGEREIGRLRLVTAFAGVAAVGVAVVIGRLPGHAPAARGVLAASLLLLIATVAAALSAQNQVTRNLGRGDDHALVEDIVGSVTGAASPWLLVSGLVAGLIGLLL